jgi:hypothetical protein
MEVVAWGKRAATTVEELGGARLPQFKGVPNNMTLLHSLKSNTKPQRKLPALGLLLAGVIAAPLAVHAATAKWSPESMLASGFAFSESDSHPGMAVSASGRAVAIWDKPLPQTGIGFGGPKEVYASVHTPATGTWSASSRLSTPGVNALNAGAVVDPASGKATVAWTSGGIPYASSSSDGGVNWITSAVPVPAGFNFLINSNLIDTDSKGNITFILIKARATADGYDIAAIVRTSGGTWRAPMMVNGATGVPIQAMPSLEVISDGRALLALGTTTFRRNARGVWLAPQTLNVSGFDIVDRVSVDMDANGRGYALLRAVTGNVGALYLYTSSQSGGWSLPRTMPALEGYYGGMQITGSSSGRALISATDSTGHVRAMATSDGGSTWSAATDLGVGFNPQADGSESGLYAITWTGSGTAGYGAWIASGSGLGTGAWTKSAIGTYVRLDTPVVAIAGKSGSTSARAAGAWERDGDPVNPDAAIGAATSTINR